MKIKVYALLMVALVFVGCGSSGSHISEVDDSNKTPIVKLPDTNETNNTNKTMLNANYMLDSKGIKGVAYSCEDNTTGITSKDGNFSYAKDLSKVCTFWINDIPLTGVNTTNIVAGEIVELSPVATKILLSLDDDHNVSNGINVLTEVVTTLNGKLKRVPDTDEELLAMVGYLSGVTAYDGRAFTDTPVSVKIIGFNTDKKYLLGAKVFLDANITGVSKNGLTYSWKEGSTVLGTDSNYSTTTFSVGNHTINLTVKDTNSKKYGEDSVTITVEDYLVNIIKPTKTVYKEDENVTLEANVTGIVVTDYTWTDRYTKWKDITKWENKPSFKDNKYEGAVIISGDDLSSFMSAELTKLFGVGHHEVTLKVNNMDKNDTFNFDVSDFSELNVTTVSNDGVIIQGNLMWVSDDDTSKEACLAVHHDNPTEINTSKTFCEKLNFAGFDENATNPWRNPTVTEVSAFITATTNANISPAYYAPCSILVGTESNGTNQAVVTRYGEGKSAFENKNAGVTYKTMDAAIAEGKNIGIRCVRTTP